MEETYVGQAVFKDLPWTVSVIDCVWSEKEGQGMPDAFLFFVQSDLYHG